MPSFYSFGNDNNLPLIQVLQEASNCNVTTAYSACNTGSGGGELFDSKGFLQFIPNGSMLFPHTTYNTVSKYLDRRRHSFIHSFAVISSSIIGARNHEHGTGVLDFGYLLLFVSPPFTGANIYFSVVIFRFDTIRHKN